jgi:hypothetical protein
VHVLEHQQHRCGDGVIGEQGERLLENSQLRTCRWSIGLPLLAKRTQRVDERLVGQLGADEIDRASQQGLEARLPRASGELGRQPRLANARFAGDQDGSAAARLRCFERVPELAQFCCASYERRFRASLHAVSIARPAPREKGVRKHPVTGR